VAADFFCEFSMLECCTHLFGQRLSVHTAIEQLVWASSVSCCLAEYVVPVALEYFLQNAAAIKVRHTACLCVRLGRLF